MKLFMCCERVTISDEGIFGLYKGKSFSPPSKTATFLPVYLDVLKQAAVLFVLSVYVCVCV